MSLRPLLASRKAARAFALVLAVCLGLSIMQTLVKDKLRGNLEIESGPEGTCARFDFKNQIIGTADVT